MNEKHHEMVLEQIHASGVEEWYCPTCGRRFLVQWPPSYKMIIVKPGDKDTRHNVSKTRTEEFRLAPWLKWMEKVDFDSRWGKTA